MPLLTRIRYCENALIHNLTPIIHNLTLIPKPAGKSLRQRSLHTMSPIPNPLSRIPYPRFWDGYGVWGSRVGTWTDARRRAWRERCRSSMPLLTRIRYCENALLPCRMGSFAYDLRIVL